MLIDIILPVYNEEESIAETLTEIHTSAVERGIDVRLIVCEDGSSDRTVEVIESLRERLPIHLISAPARKGYSRAVVDGLRASTSEYVSFMDSDGQCDPKELPLLIGESKLADLAVGYRNPRQDGLVRRGFSAAFGFVYRRLFPIRLKDPSCPYHVVSRSALTKILTGNIGILPEGFWWEYFARADALGLTFREVPVTHRVRRHGATRVYRPSRIPRIAWVHLVGLFRLKKELRSVRQTQQNEHH